jgi:hypothetical protein
MMLRRLVWSLVLVKVWFAPHGGSSSSAEAAAAAAACTRARQAQFQYPDCYLPEQNPNLLLSEASFLLSHDAATGYMSRNMRSKSGLARRYTQTQVSGTSRTSFYDQLDDGARALDIRPLLLQNGTIVFQHGIIRIDNVDIYAAMQHVLQWCHDNPRELVLLLPSHFAYESASTVSFSSRTSGGGSSTVEDDDSIIDDEVLAYYENMADYDNNNNNNADDSGQAVFAALNRAFVALGIPVYECTDVYQWTVQDAMAAAALVDGGYVMALMNPTGTSCAKENWIADEIVTRYPPGNNKNKKTTTCTTSDVPWHSLQQYLLQSANNDATSSDNNSLGPPADLYHTPLFEIQALWQIDTHAVLAGMAHWSSILNDNRQSRLNEKVMHMVYDDSFQSISLLGVDNIAMHGNALTSVLRNRCGQLADPSLPCGTNVPPPRLRYVHISPTQWLVVALSFYTVWFGYSVLYLRRPKLFYTAIARWREHQSSTSTFLVENEDTKREDLLGKSRAELKHQHNHNNITIDQTTAESGPTAAGPTAAGPTAAGHR